MKTKLVIVNKIIIIISCSSISIITIYDIHMTRVSNFFSEPMVKN